MPYYRSVGEIPPKRHTQFRQEDGSLYTEELMGEEGFSFDSALLYHKTRPTAMKSIESLSMSHETLEPNRPLMPRHMRSHKLGVTHDLVEGRNLLMGNNDCRISYAHVSTTSGLYKNAIGDEMVFVEDGEGFLDSTFGRLPFKRGDYVIIPASTIHRWVITSDTVRALILETTGHITPPKRYLSRHGQFLEHAPYCERDLHGPTEPLLEEGTDVPVLVKHRGGTSQFVFENHPFDVVGWDGCLYPHTFSIFDFEPITGRIHQPPTVHQTFEAPNLVVCSFVPRLFDYHPLAIAVPYHHANVDSDEVLFYMDGDFMSRRGSGIAQGSLSLHPAGHTHGPQPGSVEAGIGKAGTEEIAVMIDTFRPLDIGTSGFDCEDPAYLSSWQT